MEDVFLKKKMTQFMKYSSGILRPLKRNTNWKQFSWPANGTDYSNYFLIFHIGKQGLNDKSITRIMISRINYLINVILVLSLQTPTLLPRDPWTPDSPGTPGGPWEKKRAI